MGFKRLGDCVVVDLIEDGNVVDEGADACGITLLFFLETGWLTLTFVFDKDRSSSSKTSSQSDSKSDISQFNDESHILSNCDLILEPRASETYKNYVFIEL